LVCPRHSIHVLTGRPSSGTSNDPQFAAELATLKAYAVPNVANLLAVTVGSEALYRGDMTADQLVTKIAAVRQILPNTKLGTADSWNKFNDGTADPVIKVSDIM
jgi:glucan 1,3-beta-glucosidase